MTLEEKATNYAKNLPPIPADDIPYAIGCAYLEGATEALASLWKDPKEELPEVSTEVLCHDGKAHYIDEVFSVGYYDGTEWHTLDGRPIKPTHWMRIPPVKGGDGND